MPYKEKEIEKMYFSISEVAKQFNVAASLIRFWETEFDILKPRKTQKGNRLYTKKDIENFRLIYHLVKEKGYTLEGAKKKLKEGNTENMDNNAEIISRLKNIRKFLETMYNEL
ncbi:MAG TPA: MerR family transcriptional regulator [Chitinophagales bacterium]|jgi:DNA-binding transcriptional MerR regulator|nr:MerR family transcriptional regulator [Chitinophagales bacterium]HQV77312.1 MerR family transcriptional regulator [Chitinophagales bacterium]HQW78373.1 MerR family transcriptional regulator [Chitinophagales bacterium]HRB19643.1 MerR family transcriptional regulator [Chitinophagales bacterium]HRB66781.1 MerR family transcriptional regulator [Chitinophagales bacterium]